MIDIINLEKETIKNFCLTNQFNILAPIDKENKMKISEEIHEEIRKTETYKQGRNEYITYLCQLSDFIMDNLKVTDSIITARIFNSMLDNGLLSYNGEYSYKRYKKYNRYELPELKGLRVSTGTAVCRHNVALLHDLEALLNKETCYSGCVSIKKELLKTFTGEISDYRNHAILLIKKDKYMYYYDPTSNNFGQIQYLENSNISCFYNSKNIVEKNKMFLIDKNFIEKDMFDDEEDISTLKVELNKKKKLPCNNKHYISAQRKLILGDIIYDSYQDEFMDFHHDTKTQLTRMKELYEELVPLTDIKIKKHVIR